MPCKIQKLGDLIYLWITTSHPKCLHNIDSLSDAIYICPELITIFTGIQMGDVLTSSDLHVGHTDIGQPMFVNPTEAIDNTPKNLN